MTSTPDGQHLMGGADTPQEEPGDCTNLGSVVGRVWYRLGWCYGCKSWQRVRLTALGWRLVEHTPAPPRYHADLAGHPYPYPSYTQPDCNDCADETNAESAARGDTFFGADW